MTSPPLSIQPEPEHPSADTPLDTLRSLTLGFVAGLRSILPLALLSIQLEDEGPDIADGGWTLDVLTLPRIALALGVAAVAELVADKLPILPDRLKPVSLAGRVVLVAQHPDWRAWPRAGVQIVARCSARLAPYPVQWRAMPSARRRVGFGTVRCSGCWSPLAKMRWRWRLDAGRCARDRIAARRR